MSGQAYVWSQQDAARIANTVRVVERGGIEHPFHRRQGPVLGGEELVLMTSAETTYAIGPRNYDGSLSAAVTGVLTTTGTAYIVPPGIHNTPATESIDFDTTYEINASQINSLVFPNNLNTRGLLPQYTFWAVRRNGVYFAVNGGSTSFEGTVDSIYSGTEVYVEPLWEGFTSEPILCKTLFDEVTLVGQSVAVTMFGNQPKVSWAGCVPDS